MRALAALVLSACAHAQPQACLTKTPPELKSSFIGQNTNCPTEFEMCLTREQYKDLLRQLMVTESWIAYAWRKCGDGSEPPMQISTPEW